MKGTKKCIQPMGKPQKTNFGDWSDTPLKFIRRKVHKLSESDKKDRMKKLKLKTAYTQTVYDIDDTIYLLNEGRSPLMTHSEIRSHKLTFYKGLVLNLKDEGYICTSEYIKELVVLDDMYSRGHLERVMLVSKRNVLEKLTEGLKSAEDAQRTGDRTKEVQALMDIALYFINTESSFDWLIEELLELCISLLDDPDNPVHPKVESMLRFVYSSFLLDVIHDFREAKSQVQISMKLSIGKNFWLIYDEEERGDIVYLKCCSLLSKIALETSYELMESNIDEAIVNCRSSLYWAKLADKKPAIATVMLTLADMYLSANQHNPVLDLLEEYIKLCKKEKLYRELCEGYVMLSKYYETIGNSTEVVKVIEELISFGLDHGILDIVAKAHLKLAQFHNIQREASDSKRHAMAAYKYTHQQANKEENALACCLLGIAQGNQIWSKYIKLISCSDDFEGVDLVKLIEWKNLRIPFFNETLIDLQQSEIDNNIHLKHQVERLRREELELAQVKKLLLINVKSQHSIIRNSILRGSYVGLTK